MKIELKHLAPYLPYGLKYRTRLGGNKIFTLSGLVDEYRNNDYMAMHFDEHSRIKTFFINVKPLLLPLSDAIVPYDKIPFGTDGWREPNDLFIDDNGKVAMDFQAGGQTISWPIIDMQEYTQTLFANHFDVFNLITAGLALNKLDYPTAN